MAKKRPNFNQEMAIRGVNRRLFARSPAVQQKLEQSRQEFPRFKKDGSRHKRNWVKRQCEVCQQWVSASKIAVDHIDPVVPPNGFPSHFDMWDRIGLFLKRLWCDISNLQRICDECHDKKTYAERIARLINQYTEELNNIEHRMNDMSTCSALPEETASAYYKEFNKELSKYTAKKKTIGLEKIVERAQNLKNRIPKKDKNVKQRTK